MNDDQLLRYSRQILLPQWDVTGQEALLQATVLIVGAGGLGCPVAMYLAAAGVGHLIIVDDDDVELSNLQRQIAHTEDDLGKAKVDSLADSAYRLNSHTQITAIPQRLTDHELSTQIQAVQVVVDCSDNFTTRHQINRFCVQHKTPLVSGAAIRFEGQVSVFDSRRTDAPCYACLYGEQDDENLTCSENGVLAPVVGVIGSMQALETLKLLANVGETLAGKLMTFDGLHGQWRTLRLPKDSACAVCSS